MEQMKVNEDLITALQSQVLSQLTDSMLDREIDEDRKGINPNYSKQDLFNSTFVLSRIVMSKMFQLQEEEKMHIDYRMSMANAFGGQLRTMIHTYTGIDMHDVAASI